MNVLCLDLNPNCSSRISPPSRTTRKIPASRILSNNLPIVLETNGSIGRGKCWALSRFKGRDHSRVLPRLGKVTGAENRIEDMGKEGKRSYGKMYI